MYHRFGVAGRQTIDHACRPKQDNGGKLLTEAAKDSELGVINFGIGRDLQMGGNVVMGPENKFSKLQSHAGGTKNFLHLAANNIWVLTQSPYRFPASTKT